MNKELNKKLRSVGFETEGSNLGLTIKIEPNFEMIYYNTGTFYGFDFDNPITGDDSSILIRPSFEEVVEFIKTHTGVDLTLKVKKSKREEIDALKQQIKKYEDEFEAHAAFMVDNQVRILKLEQTLDRIMSAASKPVEIEKELKFTGWAETLVDKMSIPKGSKVLLAHLYCDGDWQVSLNEKIENHYSPNELKAL